MSSGRDARSPAAGRGSGALTRRDALRGVLALGALAGAGALSGCGLRLERSAPGLPLLPSARPYPGGPALREELARCQAAHDAAQAWSKAGGPPLSRTLQQLHAEQIDALRQRLRAVNEPVGEPGSGPAATTGSIRVGEPGNDGSNNNVAVLAARLLAAQTAGLDGAALAGAPAADRPLIGGCLVARAEAARLLEAPPQPGPRVPAPASADQAAALLAVIHPIRYGLEAATARIVVSGAARGPAARASLAGLRRQQQFIEDVAGSQAPVPGLGYVLPGPVDTPAAAETLARKLLGDLSDTYVRALGETGPVAEPDDGTAASAEDETSSAAQQAAIASLLLWARQAEGWRGAWGAAPRALPGR